MNIRTTLLALLCISPLATTPVHAVSHRTIATLIGAASASTLMGTVAYTTGMMSLKYWTAKWDIPPIVQSFHRKYVKQTTKASVLLAAIAGGLAGRETYLEGYKKVVSKALKHTLLLCLIPIIFNRKFVFEKVT